MGKTFSELLKAKRRIKELEKQLEPPEAPTARGIISSQDIYSLYGAIFPNQKERIHISDLEYEITAISEIRRFVDWSNVDIFEYIPEFHDCDDFALALAGEFSKYPRWSGFPTTFIWGNLYGGHAFFSCIAWKTFKERIPTVYYIEPQSDWEIAQEMVADMKLWLLPI